jgi:hypothetical protein
LTWYRTLGPITYTDGDRTEHITKAGVRVSLTPSQHDEVRGMVALDRESPLYYPRVDILAYDAKVLFPPEGDDQHVFLDLETGVLYRYINGDYGPLSVSDGGVWNSIVGKPAVIAAGATQEQARDAIGAGVRYPAAADLEVDEWAQSVYLPRGDVWLPLGTADNRLGFCQSEAGSMYWEGFDTDDIENIVKGIKAVGGTRLRFAAWWGEIEPTTRGVYDWSGLDRILDLCEEHGVEPILTLVGNPIPSYSTPTLTDFANVFSSIALRYGSNGTGQLRNYQVWNEPNHGTGPYFGSVAFGAAGYTSMLIAASNAIRSVDPEAHILAAALMSTSTYSTTDISPSTFLAQMYNYGAKDYFDTASFNWYSITADFSAYEMPTVEQLYYKELMACRTTMVANGDVAKQVWVTEFGVSRYAVPNPSTRGQILAAQIDLLTRHDWIGCFIAYNWRDTGDTGVSEHTFGLVDVDFNPHQPAYDLLTSGRTSRGVADNYITNGKIVDGEIHGKKLNVAGTGGSGKFLAYAADGTLSAATPAGGGGGGGGLDESALVDLIENPASDTRGELDALYGVPAELKTGGVPVGTIHADAGTGASLSRSGTRLAMRVTITTGASPAAGGTLATFALSGYAGAPIPVCTGADAISAATFPFVSATSSVLTLSVAGELEPMTVYTYNLMITGA